MFSRQRLNLLIGFIHFLQPIILCGATRRLEPIPADTEPEPDVQDKPPVNYRTTWKVHTLTFTPNAGFGVTRSPALRFFGGGKKPRCSKDPCRNENIQI